jgi:hypothetical protein
MQYSDAKILEEIEIFNRLLECVIKKAPAGALLYYSLRAGCCCSLFT